LQGAFNSQEQAAGSTEVVPGGDVIVAVDGQDVTSIEQLAGYLDENKNAGDTVQLTVVRDGEEMTIEAVLAEWPS
jgi:S1-C subfamily serine protease